LRRGEKKREREKKIFIRVCWGGFEYGRHIWGGLMEKCPQTNFSFGK